MAWTVVADVLLLYIAASLAMSGDARWLLATTIVVFVLLLGAADVAWDLLVHEAREADAADAPRNSRRGGRGRESRGRR